MIKAVIEDLTNDFGLNQAKEVVFSGCSAGGQGVVVNADYVESLLPSGVMYGALADAGTKFLGIIKVKKIKKSVC